MSDFYLLNTFAAIPAKALWKFLLADIRLHRGHIVNGPSCYGSLAAGVPAGSRMGLLRRPGNIHWTLNDAQYRAGLAPYTKLMVEPDDLTGVLSAVKDAR